MNSSPPPPPPPYPPAQEGWAEQRPRTFLVTELVATGLWALLAVFWMLGMLVPWFGSGVVGGVSVIEVAALIRSGVVPDVPSVAGFAVLLLPVLGTVLLGIAPLRGPVIFTLRLALWLTGVVVIVVGLTQLNPLAAGDLGGGAVLMILGAVAGACGLALSTFPRHNQG